MVTVWTIPWSCVLELGVWATSARCWWWGKSAQHDRVWIPWEMLQHLRGSFPAGDGLHPISPALLWSRDRKMQSTERLLATDVDTLFSSVKRVDDLCATYAGTKINGFCELIPQHGNRPQKSNKKGLCYACNDNPTDAQEKTCGIHRKLGNLIILFLVWFSWVLKHSLRSCFLAGHGGTCF